MIVNWKKWKKRFEFQYWQGLALSLGVDPDVYDFTEPKPMEFFPSVPGSPETDIRKYAERFEILLDHLKHDDRLKHTSWSEDGGLAHSKVSIQRFAAWAVDTWPEPGEIPQEFSVLAQSRLSIKDLERENAELRAEAERLRGLKATEPNDRETLLKIIGGLLELMARPVGGKSAFPSQAKIIDELAELRLRGFSKSTLEAKFSDAKQKLEEAKASVDAKK